jgi:hypothetical protein
VAWSIFLKTRPEIQPVDFCRETTQGAQRKAIPPVYLLRSLRSFAANLPVKVLRRPIRRIFNYKRLDS